MLFPLQLRLYNWGYCCHSLLWGDSMVKASLILADVRLAFYIHRKRLRPQGWSNNHTDCELPFLILLLAIVGIVLTGMLISLYWPSQSRTWSIVEDLWNKGFPRCLISPVLIALWFGGLVLCGAPAIVLVAVAIWT